MKLSLHLVMLAVLSTALSLESRKDETNCVVKYVKGDACSPFEGTKEHPYNTLEQAQNDFGWDVLTVLASDVALDGGITLRPGTKVIGDVDPTIGKPINALPIITNSSDVTNDGHGIIVVGDATIENIYIRGTFRSGINYDKGTDVTIKHVLITGFEECGIIAQCTQPGTTCIDHSIIRGTNDSEDSCILEANGKFHRKLSIQHSDIGNTDDSGIYVICQGATSSVDIDKCYIHHCDENGLYNEVASIEKATLTARVTDTVFESIEEENILNENSTHGTIDLYVCSCAFYQTLPFDTAIRFEDTHSTSKAIIKNCTCNNVDRFVDTDINDGDQTLPASTQHVCIKDNRVAANTFYFVGNASSPNVLGQQTTVSISGNNFTGLQAFEIAADAPWQLLDITAKNNCFVASEPAGTIGITGSPGNVGIGKLTAHGNNFEGFEDDINNITDNMQYLLSQNWWGTAMSTCVNGVCPQYQTCIKGSCYGPDNVQDAGTGTTIDTSNPLTKAITCPHGCCHRSEKPEEQLAHQTKHATKKTKRSDAKAKNRKR